MDINIEKTPIHVSTVEFVGHEKTKPEFLNGIFEKVKSSKTLGELKSDLDTILRNINGLEVFKKVNVTIDKSEENEDKGFHSVKLIVQLEERKFKLHAGTEVRRNEAALSFGGALYNVTGRGETVDCSASFGAQKATPFSFQFKAPVFKDPSKIFTFNVYKTQSHYFDNLKFNDSENAATLSLCFNSLFGSHEIKYGYYLRNLYDAKPDAGLSIKNEMGSSIKSAMSQTWVRSTRDDSIFPSKGMFARLQSELAGIGGDVAHLKHELFMQKHISILGDLVLTSSARLGHIHSLTNFNIHLLDRFHMGGPTSIRGFAANSLGPIDGKDAVGGNFVAESSVQLSFPFSKSTSDVLRGHFFANAGILSNLSRDGGFMSNYNRIKREEINSSVGVGLLLKLGGAAKLELNLGYPLSMQPNATFNHGIQLGLGVDFL